MEKRLGIILLAILLVVGFGTIAFAKGGPNHYKPHHYSNTRPYMNETYPDTNDEYIKESPTHCHGHMFRGQVPHHSHHKHHRPHYFNK